MKKSELVKLILETISEVENPESEIESNINEIWETEDIISKDLMRYLEFIATDTALVPVKKFISILRKVANFGEQNFMPK